jgi:hypothetical protein
MQATASGNGQLFLGIILATSWMVGLFAVLEMDSLLAQTLVLLALAPVSLVLDRLVCRRIKVKRQNLDMQAASQGTSMLLKLRQSRCDKLAA